MFEDAILLCLYVIDHLMSIRFMFMLAELNVPIEHSTVRVRVPLRL